ncbi:MAG: tRNA (N6-isopentenyl adenosine(37)-C2)-methylthiotransferase MiaB [Clostridiales bacterium]|nr:tRNA (N6-isopentenyl adenosine(37)-C2)-methylthiotransferase MiaB [Clostridiales bacterium]
MENRDISRNELGGEEISRQYEYMARVRDFNAASGGTKLCYVETYGCQQNEADSENLRGMALEMGYGIADGPEGASLIVFNTCAVREHAEQRVFGNIGALLKYKRRDPSIVIALTGCMAGEEHVAQRIKKSFPYVSIVADSRCLWKFPELLFGVLVNGKREFAVGGSDVIAEGLPLHRNRAVKGWLPVMYGCDNFCSYCIVPYVRGRERSRKPESVEEQFRSMVGAGYRDITLLGQNVNSYGKNSRESFETDFPKLLRRLDSIPGDYLIRFMTSHPKDAGDELFDAMRDCSHVAPHLHLPFQSGSERILKLMNRGYTPEHYLELVRGIRERIPDIVLTSDVIVGFPGETEEDFVRTLELVEKVRFDALFTFIYSPRKGTRAAEMPNDTPAEEINRRFDRLVELQNSISAEKHAAYEGKTLRVLVDGKAENKPDGWLSSRTDGGRLVVFEGSEDLIGSFVRVKINGHTTWSLSGETV